MAERRMFSKRIINSARFLKMPISCQALYFHLGLEADDDGVVEAYPVMNMTGATEDDLKVLVAKDFVRVLNEDLVTYITDWHENNKIRADRKVDSIYKNLLIQVAPDADIQQAKPRADTKKLTGQPMDVQWTTNGQPMDAIGKDSIGKDSINNNICDTPKTKKFKPPTVEEVKAYCKERNNNINAEQFVDFYTANGWKVGKNSMKDWKASVRTWERNHKDDKPKQAEEIKPKRYEEFKKEEWERPDFKAEQMPDDIRAKLGKVGKTI